MNHIYRLKRAGFNQQLQAVSENARSASKGVSTGKTIAQTVTATLASFALSGMSSLVHAQQAPPAVNQLPQGGVVTRGTANISNSTTPAGNALMTVNQGSNRAVIDWASFNVGSQAKVQFNQPSSSAVVLNNILGNNASQIYGQISANGQVFLSNPNGIYFSPTAQVNVGGLVATTGKANADEFMAGKAIFNRDGSTGSVINQGQLTSSVSGYIALLAPEVRNQGVVIAQAGTVALASGEAITLSFNNAGTGLTGITTTPQAIAALVENRSAVLAQGGQIILSAHALASLQGSVVKNSGQLSATGLIEKGGKIVLMGDNIELTGTSQIIANGPQGGGTVLVGGDWQGQGDMRQAVQVTMSQGASIEANATDNGDGGKVVLWSDIQNPKGQTLAYGTVKAEAGPSGGNGGQVETSGHYLSVDGIKVSTLSKNGKAGEWLLDPYEITIASSGASGTAFSSSYTSSATSTILASDINAALLGGNVTITTGGSVGDGLGSGNININAAIQWNSANSLSLIALGGVTGSSTITTGTGASNLIINQVGNTTFSGLITGSGRVTKTGIGTLTLSGANTFSGATIVSGGTLVVTNATGLGSISGGTTVALGATLDIQSTVGAEEIALYGTLTSSAGTASLSGVIAGDGEVTKTGTGSLTLSGANYYTGSTTVSGGTLVVSHATGLGSTTAGTSVALGATLDIRAAVGAEAVDLSGTLTSNTTGTTALSGIVSGTGGVTKFGTGTFTLSGANTYTGGTTLSSGTLSLGSASAIGSSGTISFEGGTLQSSASNTSDYSSRFSNANNQAVSIDTNGQSVTLASALSSSGGTLTKLGTGTLTLSGANTYTGPTTVSAGTLAVSNDAGLGTTAAGTTVASGATLDLQNVIVGAEALTLSGTLAASTGTSSFSGNVSIAAASTVSVAGTQLTLSGITSGSNTLTKTGAGTLTLSGANTYTGPTTVSAGTLAVSNDAGLGTTAAGTTVASGATLDLQNVTVGSEALTLSGTLAASTGTSSLSGSVSLAAASTVKVDGTQLTLSGITSGSGTLTKTGVGTLTLSGANTYTGPTVVSAGTLAVSSATGLGNSTGSTTVSTGATLDLQNVTVGSEALTLSGTLAASTGTSSLWGTVALAANSTVSVGGTQLTLSGVTSGSNTLTKTGAGTLTLSGANTYSGATTVSGGTLVVSHATGLGSTTAGTSVALGATLDIRAAVGAEAVDLSGTLTSNTTGTTALSGIVSGTGGVTKFGTGTFTLSGANTYTGGTTLSSGTLSLGSASAIGSSGTISFEGGTLQSSASNTSDYSSRFSNANNQAVSIDTNGQSVTLASALSSSGGTLTKLGSGTLTLSGANTYDGGTTVSVGTLKADSATAFGTGGITVIGSTVAAVDLNGQNMTSTGGLTLNGTGISSGGALMNSSATPATYAGLITLGSASSIVGGSGAINITNIGTITGSGYGLTLGGISGGTLSSVLGTGTGTLTKQGSGTWTLTGANTYEGLTTVSEGILAISNDTGLGSTVGATTVSTGATLDLQNVAVGAETVTLSGTLATSIGTSSLAGTVSLAAPSTLSVTGTQLNLSGIISSTITHGLTKTGTGTLTLSGANTYTGATTVSAGTLVVGHATALGSTSVSTTVAAGATIDLQNVAVGNETINLSGTLTSSAGTVSWSGVISGSGVLNKTGAGTLTLTGANTYTGGTTVSAGTLQIGSGSTSGNITSNVINNANLTFNRSDAVSFSNLISGTGAVTKLGANTITLFGNNTYSGGTTVSAGTLKAGSATAFGSGAISVTSGSAIDLNGQTMTSTGDLTLNGTGISSGGALMNSHSTAGTYSGLITLGSASSIVGGTGAINIINTGTITGSGLGLTLGGVSGGTLSSVLGTGSGTLTKQGSGTWTLSAANTYSGVTTISAGTLAVANDNGLGGTTNGTVIESGATLELRSVVLGNEAVSFGGVSTGAGGVLLASGGTSSLAGSLTITTPYSTSPVIKVTGTQLTLSGVISTTGGISYGVKKQGTGTLVLSGANTYIGATLIEAGILRLGSSISPIGAQTGGNTTVSSGAALDLNGYSISPTVTLFLNGTGINSGGALMNSGAAATWQSPITLSSNSSIVADGGTIALTGNIAGAGKALTLGGSAGGTLSGVIANASGSTTLTKEGSGTWTLSGASTYIGGTTVSAGTLKSGVSTTGSVTNGPFGTGTITVNGGTLDLNGKTLANALTLNGGGSTGALLNSSGTAATSSGAVSIATATTMGGSGNVTLSGAISGATSGLAFVGTGNYTLSNIANALSTIASGSGVGSLSVLNASALSIGQVTLGGTTYSGISSTGTVSVTTNSGDLTVSQNISTSSTSSNTSTPALKLSAGASTAAGTATGGDVVLSGSPSISVGSGGIAAIYSGNYSSASALNTFITAQTNNYSLFSSGTSTLPASGQGFYGIYRGSNAVPIYLLAVSGQSSEYGTAPILKYAYSTSPTSIVSTSITGIPSGELSFTLTGGSVSQSVNVGGGVTGTIALTGTPSISSTGLVSNTSAGAYALTLTPSLTLSGYSFAAGTNPVTYTINPKPITATGVTGVNKVYDGGLSATLNGSLQGVLSADASSVTFNGTGTFSSKNVGNTIAITSTSTLSGAASGNYALNQPTGMTANITRLNSVTWTGGATGDWLNPANWAGGAVPDKSNVANVVIPAGKTVSFNNVVTGTAEAGSVNVDGITGSTGSLTVSAGTLAVGSSGVTLSNLTQTGGTFSTQGAMSLGSGSLAVSAANYSLGAVSTSGAFSVTNSGGDVTLSGNVTGGNSALLIKSTGNIIQNASTAVSTTGGNITYWADSDASGAGYIALTSGTSAATKASVSAGTGNIVFGGGNGATAADGAATGVKGITLGTYASLSGANISLVGRGSASAVGSFTSGTVGVEVADYASVVGTGAVAITGTGGGGSAASASSSNIGVQIGVQFGSTTVESTGNSVAITGAGGGTGNASLNNFGVFLTGMNGTSSTVRTAAGDLTIRGTEGTGTTITGYNRNSGIYVHGDVQLGGTSQTGALNLLANDVLWPMMATAKMQTTGAVTIAPISTSFVTEQRMGTNVLLAGTPASLTIGKVDNTATLNLLTTMSVAGPISLMGGPISLNANLTSTGLISLKSYGGTAGIQQGLPSLGTPWGIISAPLVSVTATNNPVILGNDNAIGTVAVTGASNVRVVNAGALTVGSAGGVTGISASGTVVAITNTSDLTIAGNIATTSTSSYVMNLEAGFNANPGDSTGGNILLTNSSTITTGLNATARLYSGSLAGSTALAAYVGAGSGRFRYGSDGTTSNFTQGVSPGLNLIYREKPTVSWSNEADQSIVYGQSMTYSTTGSLNTYGTTNNFALGLQNGDEAKVSQALLVRTSVAPKTTAKLNSSNVYDAGVYEVSKTAAAEALGYAATNPKITVTQAPLTITAKDASKVYDGGAYSLGNGLNYSGFVASETTSVLGGSAVYGGAAQGAINAGSYTLTVAGLTAKNYSITYNPGTLTVSPKPLTIRVNDDARFVGQSDTAGYAGASYTGFVTGESISTLGSLSITRTATSAAGTYVGALQASIPGLTNNNYNITYTPGNYTIVPADQLLIKLNNVATTYGTDPVYAITSAQYLKSGTNVVIDLTPRASITGTSFSLTDGDGGSTSFTVAAQSASLSTAGQLNAYGGYQLGASSVNNSSTNYNNTITTTGALTVNPKTVSASVGSGLSKTYDGNASMPSMSLTLSGALPGDKVSATGQGVYAGANAGTTNYDVKNLVLSGVDQANYVLTAGNRIAGTNGAINKAALSITAQSDRKIYDGEAYVGGNGVTYSGLVNNEEPSVLAGALSYSGTSQNAVNAGTYIITPQGLSSNNYNFNYVNAPLTIEPASITTSSVNVLLQGPITKVYDGNDTATLTSSNYILSGWVGTDTASVTKTTGTYDNPNAGGGKLVSVNLSAADYLAGAGTNLANYVLPTSIFGAVGRITPKPVSVSGLTATNKTYDGNTSVAISNWGSVATGIANENLSLVLGTASFANANAENNKSVTAIGYSLADGTGGLASNYVLSNSVGTTTADISTKAVAIAGTGRTTTYDATSTYSDLSNTTGFVANGLVQGDWVTSVNKTLGGTGITPTGIAQAGTYTVMPSSAVMGLGNASNYTFSYTAASNTVDQANLAVSATPSLTGNVYRGTAYTGTYTTTALGSDASALTVTGVATGIDAGTYSSGLSVSGAVLSNYNTPVITNANLVISPKAVSVSNTARSTTYDGTSSYGTLASGTAFTTSALVGSDAVASVTQTASGIGVTPSGIAQAGSYTVTPSAALLSTGQLSNYTFSYAAATNTVDKANLAVSATPSLTGNVYRGTAYTGTYTTTALGSDASALTVSGVATGIDAGTYSSGLSVSGAVLSNYNTPVITNANLVISPAQLSVLPIAGTLQGTVSKSYDGSSEATLSSNNYLLTGWLGNDMATVTKTSGTYDDAKAGLGKTVNVSLTNSDYKPTGSTKLSNYSLPQRISGAVGNIEKAPLKVQVNHDAKFVTQSDSVGYSGVSYSGWVAGETASVLGGSVSVVRSAVGPDGNASSSNALAGSYTGVLTASGLSSQNYAITYAPGNYTIVPADQLLVRMSPAANVYGTTPNLTVREAKYMNRNNVIVDLTANISRSGNNFTVSDGVGGSAIFTVRPVSALTSGAGQLVTGSYQLQPADVNITSNNFNNNLTLVGAQTVHAAPLTLTFVAANKVYDGESTATLTSNDNRVTGDAISVSATGTFIDKNAGTGKAVGVTGVKLSGADASNYIVNSSPSATADITRLPAVTWIGGASGSWYDSANWSGGVVPDPNNVISVVIPKGVTVTPMLFNVTSENNLMTAPVVVAPRTAQASQSYQVTLIQSPQANVPGLLHIELPIVPSDVQLSLPVVLQNWIAAAGPTLELEGLTQGILEGVNLTDRGTLLSLLASVDRRSPLEFVMRSAREQVKVRIVWKP